MMLSASLLKRSWFLAGPTAVGKTATSLLLAHRLGAEIISLDSMAIYRGMDIGTAKPNSEQRQQIRHHLIDVADPHEDFSVAEFVRRAAIAAEEICHRGHVPLFVGGTGLYLRTMLRGLFEGPSADWPLRQQFQEEVLKFGPQWLHQQLQQVDAVTAARLHPGDVRRIIRALEVFHLTGRPVSDDHTQHARPSDERPRAVVWLSPERSWLHARIHQRVDNMMQQGLLEETQRLMHAVPPPGRTASQALGYRELMSCLRGECALQVAVDQIRTGTRQFAKRQQTWFRNLEECQPLTMTGDETPEQLCDRILHFAQSP